MANNSKSFDESLLWLLMIVGGGLVFYVWMQIKAAAESLGVAPDVLLGATVIAMLMIGVSTFIWLQMVVEKSHALLPTTATLLWMVPVRMLLNSKAELTQSINGVLVLDTPATLWYNNSFFVWGVGACLAVLAIRAWRD